MGLRLTPDVVPRADLEALFEAIYANAQQKEETMNWYSPLDAPQLLPKDLLQHARKFTKDEAEKNILDTIKKAVTKIVGQPIMPMEWEMRQIQAAARAQAVIGSTTSSSTWGDMVPTSNWGTFTTTNTGTFTHTV